VKSDFIGNSIRAAALRVVIIVNRFILEGSVRRPDAEVRAGNFSI